MSNDSVKTSVYRTFSDTLKGRASESLWSNTFHGEVFVSSRARLSSVLLNNSVTIHQEPFQSSHPLHVNFSVLYISQCFISVLFPSIFYLCVLRHFTQRLGVRGFSRKPVTYFCDWMKEQTKPIMKSRYQCNIHFKSCVLLPGHSPSRVRLWQAQMFPH